MLFESIQDFPFFKVFDGCDALLILVEQGDPRNDEFEEFVGGVDIFFQQVVVDDMVDYASCSSPFVILIKLLLESVFYRGRLSCVFCHNFN